MTKRIKKNKKCSSSSIDEQYIDSYKNLKKSLKPEKNTFQYDLLGKSNQRKKEIVESKKSIHYKNKNSPEFAKIKKLIKKTTANYKMNLDIEPSKENNAHDIWNQSIFEENGKKSKLKNINQIIPAVEIPHPGQSYNPDPEDYKSLVNQSAKIIDLNKQEDTPKGVLKLDEMLKEMAPTLDTSDLDLKAKQAILKIKEEKEIDKILSGEVEPETEDEDEIEDDVMSPKRTQKRKTKTQRNREKLLKEEKRKKMVIKRIKKMKNDVNHINHINRISSLDNTNDSIDRCQKFLTRLITGETPTKISNKKFYPDPPEANLPEEVSSSVKNIVNTNINPIKNVYKSIYRRGLLPPPPKFDNSYRNRMMKIRAHNRNKVYKIVLSN